MSGTSLDGIDVAAIATDGRRRVIPGPALTVPYPEPFREQLRSVLGGVGEVAAVEAELTRLHAAAIAQFRAKYPDVPVELIGFHGHTVLHRPAERRTWQIGDGALLARLAGADVVADPLMRRRMETALWFTTFSPATSFGMPMAGKARVLLLPGPEIYYVKG